MKYKYLGIGLIVFIIAILFGLFSFYLYNTRAVSETKLELQLRPIPESQKEYSITNLNELKAVISELNKNTSDRNLLSIFEREREHYILLITVLGLILTVSIAYTVINKIIDKGEFSEQKNRVEELEKELKKSIEDIRIKNIERDIMELSFDLNYAKTTYIGNSSSQPITSEKEFIYLLSEKAEVKNFLELIIQNKEKKLTQKSYVLLHNLIKGVNIYSYKKGFSSIKTWDEETNYTFREFTRWVECKIGRAKFSKLKESITKLPNVTWIESK